MARSHLRHAFVLITSMFTWSFAGCAFIDTVDDRAMTLNQSVNRYRNNAILNNIVRASKNEPLNFAAISGIVGHNTVQLGLPGTPAMSFTPKILFTSESATNGQYSFSNDFTYTEVDDAATTQALATPLDPATMANFFQRGIYPSDFLLLLFVNKMRIADRSGRILAEYYSGALQQSCDISDPQCPIRDTLLAFTWVATQGLTFRTEKGAVPGQSKSPQAQICFEPSLQRGTYLRSFIQLYGRYALRSRQDWLEPSRMLVPATAGVPPSYCNDAKTWLNAPSPAAPTTMVCVQSDCDKKKSSAPPETPSASYKVFDAADGVWIELYTRSTYGIYDFLGSLLNRGAPIRMLFGDYPFQGPILFFVTHDAANCFALVFDGFSYCVPNINDPNNSDADRTKAAFSIVHQLAALYTSAVSTAPNTSTVRITP
jgi:hypothetical protein